MTDSGSNRLLSFGDWRKTVTDSRLQVTDTPGGGMHPVTSSQRILHKQSEVVMESQKGRHILQE